MIAIRVASKTLNCDSPGESESNNRSLHASFVDPAHASNTCDAGPTDIRFLVGVPCENDEHELLSVGVSWMFQNGLRDVDAHGVAFCGESPSYRKRPGTPDGV